MALKALSLVWDLNLSLLVIIEALTVVVRLYCMLTDLFYGILPTELQGYVLPLLLFAALYLRPNLMGTWRGRWSVHERWWKSNPFKSLNSLIHLWVFLWKFICPHKLRPLADQLSDPGYLDLRAGLLQFNSFTPQPHCRGNSGVKTWNHYFFTGPFIWPISAVRITMTT